MIQGEELEITWTVTDTPLPDLNTFDEIEVAVSVNNKLQLTFKKSLPSPLAILVDGTNTNKCSIVLSHDQTILFPTGQLQTEISLTMAGKPFKAKSVIDIILKTKTA